MDDERLIKVRQASRAYKLTIAQNLERIWSDVLQEPLPEDLQRLVRKLEQEAPPTRMSREADKHRVISDL
jgi:hypothetical protein